MIRPDASMGLDQPDGEASESREPELEKLMVRYQQADAAAAAALIERLSYRKRRGMLREIGVDVLPERAVRQEKQSNVPAFDELLAHLPESQREVVSDPDVASLLGLEFSAKLNCAANGARNATFDENNALVFDKGSVDFKPVRQLVAGSASAPFPPAVAQPGSVGDQFYSPLVRVGNITYNAPIIAFDVEANDINFPNGGVDYTKVHDEVLAIDPFQGTVTLQMVNGFSFGRPIWYISMDASVSAVAAIKGATFAPLMQALVTGRDDSFRSPVERLFIATNGPFQG